MSKSLVLAALLLAPAWASASHEDLKAPIDVPAIGFKAWLEDGRVISTWHRYKREDFFAYKLVKSSTKDAPLYPEDQLVLSSENQSELRCEDGKLSAGTWHYRLVIVTRFGDRWVSPPVSVTVGQKDLKRAAPTVADFE